MAYLEYNFTINPLDPIRDVLVAELCEAGFESFVENDKGVLAYIPNSFDEGLLEGMLAYQMEGSKISFVKKQMEDKNWNEEWESNFDPIDINNKCLIRAPFHSQEPGIPLEVIIQPQMSFGTGHHETTFLISSILLDKKLSGFRVLDMGSGTGVLAILAEKLGAIDLDAIDIDEWSFENAKENLTLNNSTCIKTYLGGKEQLIGQEPYDLILANINRNILLEDMESYVEVLKVGSEIIFSGFYKQDISLIQEKGESLGLSMVTFNEKNNWVAVTMKSAIV